jgi:hypothetical protein
LIIKKIDEFRHGITVPGFLDNHSTGENFLYLNNEADMDKNKKEKDVAYLHLKITKDVNKDSQDVIALIACFAVILALAGWLCLQFAL